MSSIGNARPEIPRRKRKRHHIFLIFFSVEKWISPLGEKNVLWRSKHIVRRMPLAARQVFFGVAERGKRSGRLAVSGM